MLKNILLVYIIYFSFGLSRAEENTELPKDLQLNETTSLPSCQNVTGLNFFEISTGNYSLIKMTEIPALITICTEVEVSFIKDEDLISITLNLTSELNDKPFNFNISQNSSKCHFKSGAKVGDYTLKFVKSDRNFIALCAYSSNITNQASYGFVLTKNESFTDNDLKAFVSQSGVKEIQNDNTIGVTQAKNCSKKEINPSKPTTNTTNVSTEGTKETSKTTEVSNDSIKSSDDQRISKASTTNVGTGPSTKKQQQKPTTKKNTSSSATIQTPTFFASFVTILVIFQQYLKSIN